MPEARLTITAALSIFFAAAYPLHARANEVGVSSNTILFGQAAALEGPSSALGLGMRQGILAATLLRPEKAWYLQELARHLRVPQNRLGRPALCHQGHRDRRRTAGAATLH